MRYTVVCLFEFLYWKRSQCCYSGVLPESGHQNAGHANAGRCRETMCATFHNFKQNEFRGGLPRWLYGHDKYEYAAHRIVSDETSGSGIRSTFST